LVRSETSKIADVGEGPRLAALGPHAYGMSVGHEWDAEAAAGDLAAVDELLAGLPAAGADERLRAIAAHFERRYGVDDGRLRLGAFVRLCLYLDRHGADLRARGLMDEAAHSIDRAFLEQLLARLAAADGATATVAAVPSRDVKDETVED
jgi:hypothetical protein